MRSTVVDLGSQPIRNLSSDPRATRYISVPNPNPAKSIGWLANRYPGNTSYTLITGATDGPPEGGIITYSRATTTTAATFGGLGHHLAENPEVGSPNAQYLVPVAGGEQMGLSVWVRTSIACQAVLRVRFAAGTTWLAGSVGSAAQPHITVNLAANTWTRVVLTKTVPATATGMGAFLVVNDVLASGVTIDGTGQMFTRGDAHPTSYYDGNTPGWRWTGAANLSESVGYPYTLESIAGQPLASLSAAGSSAPLGLDAYEGRTLYAVHDVIDTASNLATIATIGNTSGSGTGRMTIRTGSTGGSTIELRTETIGGSVVFSNRSAVRTVGRHVTSGAINQGLTAPTVTVDGVGGSTPTLTPGQGFYTGELCLLWLPMADASNVPIFAAAYRGEHDAETRKRITAWLARKYGAPIPAGY